MTLEQAARYLLTQWRKRCVEMEADPWHSNRVDELTKCMSELEAALAAPVGGQPLCPRPCNDRPEQFTAAYCVAAGECGCDLMPAVRLALNAAAPHLVDAADA